MGRNLLRYPGGKQRFLAQILCWLPPPQEIKGRFIDPFVGGGAVFFATDLKRALLSDKNQNLIDLYRGIRLSPQRVWGYFSRFPSTKAGYYRIRGLKTDTWDLIRRAARALYLNRTCFKGMWRHNSKGEFNVGYGGQGRRWVITLNDLKDVSHRLRHASLQYSDFERIIDDAACEDFLFLDPPYAPGKREMDNDHYLYSQFTFRDHMRLARALHRATRRGTRWALTTSAHRDILALFPNHSSHTFKCGVGHSPGLITDSAGEVLIRNY